MLRLVLYLALSLHFAPAGAATYPLVVTVDDLPGQDSLADATILEMNERIVQALTEAGVPAVGFVNESRLYADSVIVPERVAALELWPAAGMSLGNHTYAHTDLHKVAVDAFIRDIARGQTVTREILARYEQTPRYFRHPYLHTGRDEQTRLRVETFLSAQGYVVAPVTIDNSEWIYARAYDNALNASDAQLAARLGADYVDYMLKKAAYYRAQAMALFGREIPQITLIHANRLNADHLAALLNAMAQAGAVFTTLDTAIADEAFASHDNYFGPAGITWIHRWAISAGKRRAFFGDEPAVPQWVMDAAGLKGE